MSLVLVLGLNDPWTEEPKEGLTGPNLSFFFMTRTGYYHLIHRKVAATEMLLMGGLSTGLVSNPSRASIEAQTEKVKAALVRGESFDSGKPFSPGKFHLSFNTSSLWHSFLLAPFLGTDLEF